MEKVNQNRITSKKTGITGEFVEGGDCNRCDQCCFDMETKNSANCRFPCTDHEREDKRYGYFKLVGQDE